MSNGTLFEDFTTKYKNRVNMILNAETSSKSDSPTSSIPAEVENGLFSKSS